MVMFRIPSPNFRCKNTINMDLLIVLILTDVGIQKSGSCPSNASNRDYLMGKKCTNGFDCRGVKKCCYFSPELANKCIDPELQQVQCFQQSRIRESLGVESRAMTRMPYT